MHVNLSADFGRFHWKFHVVLRRREICGNWYCWRLVALIFRDGFNLVLKVFRRRLYIFWNCICKYYCVALTCVCGGRNRFFFLEEMGHGRWEKIFKFFRFIDENLYTKHEYMKIKLYNWTFQLPYFFNSSSTSFVSFRILDYIYEKREVSRSILFPV